MDMTNRTDKYQLLIPQDVLYLEGFADRHQYLFEDMLFSKGSITNQFIMVKRKNESGEWVDRVGDLPPELCDFTYDWFDYHISDLEGTFAGCFNPGDQSLTIDTKYVDNESVILHEMIHLHEYVLNELPMFYHDSYFWCLYTDLRDKIPDLDERIRDYGHVHKERNLAELGGVHDLTFLLKSFDIDLRMGYKLGTVFGYGYDDGQKGLDI